MHLTLTDNNFDAEISKATLPVLVDFYADWCVAPETNILLEDGNQIEASKIVPGQKLLGLGDNKLALGCVIQSRTAKDLGHCREVVLNTGRKVKVTDEHLFYGTKGWVASKDLKEGNKIAVLPSPDPPLGDIMSTRDLILARLAGILFTDGTLYYHAKNRYWEVSFTLGQERDVRDLTRDLQTLGFNNVRAQEITKNQEISGRKFTTHIFKVKCLSKNLFNLMKTSGVPVGAKKSQEYTVPAWIKNGDLKIKREFLRGFMGGDGPKVDIRMVTRSGRSSYNHVGINDLEFHKNFSLEKSGLQLAQEVATLLNDFGVTITKVFSERDTYVRRDGQKSSIIHLCFKHDFETALNLVTRIGYAYSWQKENGSQIAGEFLRQIYVLRKKWQDSYKKAIEMASQDLDYRNISQALNVHPSQTYSWVKGKVRATIAQHGIKFDRWLSDALENAPQGFIWESVENVSPVFLPFVAKVSVADTQSFVSNGILSHNCGPCKMVAPIVEEIAKEYEGKLIVGKVDVDQNPKTAQKFNVMSIPTLILFKSGQPVKQFVGFQSKEALLKTLAL